MPDSRLPFDVVRPLLLAPGSVSKCTKKDAPVVGRGVRRLAGSSPTESGSLKKPMTINPAFGSVPPQDFSVAADLDSALESAWVCRAQSVVEPALEVLEQDLARYIRSRQPLRSRHRHLPRSYGSHRRRCELAEQHDRTIAEQPWLPVLMKADFAEWCYQSYPLMKSDSAPVRRNEYI